MIFIAAEKFLLPQETNAIKVLHASFYKSVNTGLFLKSLVAQNIFKFSMFPFLMTNTLAVKHGNNEFDTFGYI